MDAQVLRDSPARSCDEVHLASGAQQHLIERVRQHLGAGVAVLPVRPRSIAAVAHRSLPTGGDVLWTRRPYALGPVVLAFDPSRPFTRALLAARALAPDVEQLAVVHGLGGRELPPPAHACVRDLTQRLRASLGPGPSIRIVHDEPAFAAVAAERELGARLLVVGAACPADVAAAMRVAAAATGPVLLVREAASGSA